MSTYTRTTNNGQGANLCMVVCALMHGKKTRQELMAVTGISNTVIKHTLDVLRENGLAYKHSLRPHELREDGTYQTGPYPIVYAFNNPPFSHGDFPKH